LSSLYTAMILSTYLYITTTSRPQTTNHSKSNQINQIKFILPHRIHNAKYQLSIDKNMAV